jgi:hypothetical protein
VLDGPECPDVMVIAARGTNIGTYETPTNSNWQDPTAYTSDPNHGAGAILYPLYNQLVNANQNLKFSLEPVVYPTTLSLTQLVQYVPAPSTGAANILLDIQTFDALRLIQAIL